MEYDGGENLSRRQCCRGLTKESRDVLKNPLSNFHLESTHLHLSFQGLGKLIPHYCPSENKAVPVQHKVGVLHHYVPLLIFPSQFPCQVLWLSGLSNSEDSYQRVIGWKTVNHFNLVNMNFLLVLGGIFKTIWAAWFCWTWRDITSAIVQPPNSGRQ